MLFATSKPDFIELPDYEPIPILHEDGQPRQERHLPVMAIAAGAFWPGCAD